MGLFTHKPRITAHTYSQFTDTVFGLLQKVQNIPQMPTLIGVRQENLFGVYIDDHIRVAKTFDVMYTFLSDSYFSRVVFGPVYLLGKKTKAFMDTLKLLGFERSRREFRLSIKHGNKIKQMLVPILQEELDVLL